MISSTIPDRSDIRARIAALPRSKTSGRLGEASLPLRACAALVLLYVVPFCHAQANMDKPEVWMMPPGNEGRSFRELSGQPEAWQETRSLIHVLGCTDLQTQKLFTDDELRGWFALMNGWGLKFGVEVGAIKEWGLTGAKTFAAERPLWERVQRLGGKIYAVAMDEPLVCCRQHIRQTDAYAVQETANYIALVRQHFPDVRVGDIEAYPSIPLPDHIWWIEALNKRLAEMKVRGLDFYRLDVDWAAFVVRDQCSWRDVKKIEQACRKRNLPFSLIYWASGLPAMQRKGLADDSTWYTGIMQQGYDYAFVGGAPDQVVIESWVQAPARVLPETGEFTFTRSVRDFVKKFVQAKQASP